MNRAAALAVAALAFALVAAAPPSGPAPQLRREGRWMVDEHGRIVITHGVNAVWKLPPYCPPDTAEGFGARDADWLVEHGFTSVRLGVLFVGVMPTRDVIDAAYLDCIQEVVDLLAERKIWVLLDAHQDLYNERFHGEGFPDWAVHDDGLPPEPYAGFPGSYFVMPAVNRAFDNLYANEGGVQDTWADAWAAVAARFRDQPYLMGYDLFNEPWPGSQWPSCFNTQGCPAFDSNQLQPLQERLLAGIREVDSDNIVWIEPNLTFDFGPDNGFDTLRPFPDDEQLGFTYHNYGCLEALAELRDLGYESLGECEVLEGRVFDNADAAGERLGAATLLGEFGASDNLGDLHRVLTYADDHLAPWQYWAYKAWADPTTSGPGEQSMFADDADLDSVKLEKLLLLERAYPMATAGIPLTLQFDPTGPFFHYEYVPRPANAPTVIHVPEIHYPDGYLPIVLGGRATSPPGARALTVEADPGVDRVIVELLPVPIGPIGPTTGTTGPTSTGSATTTGTSSAGTAGSASGGPTPATGGGVAAAGLALLLAATPALSRSCRRTWSRRRSRSGSSRR